LLFFKKLLSFLVNNYPDELGCMFPLNIAEFYEIPFIIELFEKA
jgi:hypothetical protein